LKYFTFKGTNCEKRVEWCTSVASNPCQNNGKCSKIDESYKCECSEGYDGDECQTNIDDCANHKCQFGVCVDGVANYTCKCKEGFSGTFCEVMNPIALALQNTPEKTIVQYQKVEKQQQIGCTVNDCSNGGICYRTSVNGQVETATKCKCQLGYAGDKCEILKMVQYKFEDSYLEFESPDFEQKLNFTFSMVTEAEQGVLFYHGSKAKKHLAVELFKGRLRISYVINDEIHPRNLFSHHVLNDSKF
jgi:slit protein 2